jgi:hypothetical protein
MFRFQAVSTTSERKEKSRARKVEVFWIFFFRLRGAHAELISREIYKVDR